jgi:hypothetical protein
VALGEESEQGVVIGGEIADMRIQGSGGEDALRVGLPAREGAEPRVTEHGDAVFDSANDGAEILVQELDVTHEPLLVAAARTVFTIESAEFDPLFAMDLEIPGAPDLIENEDGSITAVNDNGEFLAYVGAPWAVDAGGDPVNIWYESEDRSIYQYVDHLSRAHEYPILADPAFLVPVLLAGGRIVIQRVVAASASAATRSALAAVARAGLSVIGRASL